MLYCLKAAEKLKKVQTIPCSDCKSICEVSIFERDKYCFKNCKYPVMTELLDENQIKLYEIFRPDELKSLDSRVKKA